MATLVITINGPFAYVSKGATITAMAAMCPQHTGGISTIDAEFEFVGNKCNKGAAKLARHSYSLDFKATIPQATTPGGDGDFLTFISIGKFKAEDWRFWITLPRPNMLIPVNPVCVDLSGTAIKRLRNSLTVPLGVGARFIYNEWDGCDVNLLYNGKPIPNDNGPITFKFDKNGEPAHGDITIEYAGAVRSDPFHEDAVECFATLMRGLGVNLSVAFPASNGAVELIHSNDCKAPTVMILGSGAHHQPNKAKRPKS